MTGGLKNPLGAKAIYLGNTLYRIHGTNEPSSIGSAASSGCIRMHNEHVVHLAGMVNAGTTVYVMKRLPKGGTIMPPAQYKPRPGEQPRLRQQRRRPRRQLLHLPSLHPPAETPPPPADQKI